MSTSIVPFVFEDRLFRALTIVARILGEGVAIARRHSGGRTISLRLTEPAGAAT